MYSFSLEEGTIAVKVARRVIESTVLNEDPGEMDIPERFKEPGGVFTTINRYPSRDLRGCIGYSEPVMPIILAIIRSAKAAATQDPRFSPVKKEELDRIVVEVSLLTPPEPLKASNPDEYPQKIKIGEHGLIVQMDGRGGLLLPQVPVELEWNSYEFLNNLCMKAGLPSKCWRTGKAKLFTFTAEVFEERTPRGKVVRKEL